MNSATTADAKSVDLNYSISGADLSQPFWVGIFRSPTPDATSFNISNSLYEGLAQIPSLDEAGKPTTSQDSHSVQIPLGFEIPIDPTKGKDPYVFVVANPYDPNQSPYSNNFNDVHVPESDDPSDPNHAAPLGELTASQVTNILGPVAAQYVGPLNEALGEFSIITPRRQAAFLGQIAVESASPSGPLAGVPLSSWKQVFNSPPSDPFKYGRGPIQLTHKYNYQGAQNYFGFSDSIVDDPDLVATDPEIGFLTSAWFWSVQSSGKTQTVTGVYGMNHYADTLSFTGPPVTPNPSFLEATVELNANLTRIVTGSYRQTQMRRWAYYVKALTQLLPQDQ